MPSKLGVSPGFKPYTTFFNIATHGVKTALQQITGTQTGHNMKLRQGDNAQYYTVESFSRPASQYMYQVEESISCVLSPNILT